AVSVDALRAKHQDVSAVHRKVVGILETDLEECGWLWEYPDYFSGCLCRPQKSSRDTPTASRILPGLFPEYLCIQNRTHYPLQTLQCSHSHCGTLHRSI